MTVSYCLVCFFVGFFSSLLMLGPVMVWFSLVRGFRASYSDEVNC